MTLEEMNEVKSFFDKGIVSKDYTGLETCVIEIPESIKFATGYLSPNEYEEQYLENIEENVIKIAS